jgi:hypothetical protein
MPTIQHIVGFYSNLIDNSSFQSRLDTLIGHRTTSSNTTNDDVIYPAVPDTHPTPYYSWNITRNQPNYYGYNDRYSQITIRSYNPPYPTVLANGWRFNYEDDTRIFQKGIKTTSRCFQTIMIPFRYKTTIQIALPTTPGTNCTTSNDFWLDQPPASFVPASICGAVGEEDMNCPEGCTCIQGQCECSGGGGGGGGGGGSGGGGSGNEGEGNPSGEETTNPCDFSDPQPLYGIKHQIVVLFGPSDNDTTNIAGPQVACRITHYLFKNTTGTTTKYGHYLELEIKYGTTQSQTVKINTRTNIRFTIEQSTPTSATIKATDADTNTDLASITISNPNLTNLRYYAFNTVSVAGGQGGISPTEAATHIATYTITENTTQNSLLVATLTMPTTPSTWSSINNLTLVAQHNNPPTNTNTIREAWYKLRNDTRWNRFIWDNSVQQWVSGNLSSDNPVTHIRIQADVPLESLLLTGTYAEPPPPPPPPAPQGTPFTEHIVLGRTGFNTPGMYGQRLFPIFVSSMPELSDTNLTRFGPNLALGNQTDKKLPNTENHLYRYLMMGAAMNEHGLPTGRIGPGHRFEIVPIQLGGLYPKDGFLWYAANSVWHGTPIFIDIQPITNPAMYNIAYNWHTSRIQLFKWDNNTNSWQELEENEEIVPCRFHALVLFKTL